MRRRGLQYQFQEDSIFLFAQREKRPQMDEFQKRSSTLGAPSHRRPNFVGDDARRDSSGAAELKLERAKGIEPSYAAWEAAVLPLNYARDFKCLGKYPFCTWQFFGQQLFP
jgi:hypothetical protein